MWNIEFSEFKTMIERKVLDAYNSCWDNDFLQYIMSVERTIRNYYDCMTIGFRRDYYLFFRSVQ